MSYRRDLKVAAVLAVAAAALYFGVGLPRLGDEPSELATLPLDVAGAPASMQFKGRKFASYRVSVRGDRALPHHETECLLGASGPGPQAPCPSGFGAPEVSWSISADGRKLSPSYEFSGGGGYSRDWISLDLATVELRAWETYTVSAQLRGASRLMRQLRPRLVVELDGMEIEDALGRALAATLLAGLLAVASVVLLGLALVARLKKPGSPPLRG